MTACVSQIPDRTVMLLATPALWPAWPFLAVVRRTKGRVELGIVIDSRSAGVMGYSSTVFLTCLFLMPATWDEFLALPRETFDSAAELVSAGWQVD